MTGLSGRNRALGELIGAGCPGDQAIADMEGRGQTVRRARRRAAGLAAWSKTGSASWRPGHARPCHPATVLASLRDDPER